jgi:hypothetical protein
MPNQSCGLACADRFVCAPFDKLRAGSTRANLRRVSDPNRVTQIFNQFDEPLTVPRRFHPDQHRRRQLLIKPLRIAAGVDQLPLPTFSRLRIQPTNLLPG